jgi:hypothetical protein
MRWREGHMAKRIFYATLGVVFVASSMGALFLPDQVVRRIAASTALVSVTGAIFQVVRDSVAHERSLSILESQNAFSMGATSHMANVAFDNYSSFCEEYVAEMFLTLATLMREGPRKSAFEHGRNLSNIRNKWAVWLTPEIDGRLAPIEKELRTIGSEAWIHEQAPGHGSSEAMFTAFAKVIGLENWQGKPLRDEFTVTAVINQLRRILGTEELSRLRSELVTRALRNIADRS